MNAVLSTLETLRSRFVGDALTGLNGEAAEEKARSLSSDRVAELRTEALAIPAEAHGATEEASRQEMQGLQLHAQEQRDLGNDIWATKAWDPATAAELQLAVCRRYIDRYAAEFGLRDQPGRQANVSLGDIIMAANARAAMLGRILAERFARDGEPQEVTALRARIREARKAEWEPREAQRKAHERNNGTGGLFEAEAHEANAKLWAAEAVTEGLKRELADRYGITA